MNETIELIKNIIIKHNYLYPIILYILIGVISYKILDKIIYKISQFNNPLAIHWTFTRLIIKTILIIIVIYASLILIPSFQTIPTLLLTNISIITAAFAFASQNLLNNIISGIILSATKPFAVNDRIKLINNGVVGFIEAINFRYTTIKTVNNNRFLVPNSIIMNEILENFNYADNHVNSFVDLSLTFNSNISKAKTIISDIITSNPLFFDVRTQEDKDNNVPVVNILTRDISNFRIELRAIVWSNTIGENFTLCSEIREKIIEIFNNTSDIHLYQQELVIKQ